MNDAIAQVDQTLRDARTLIDRQAKRYEILLEFVEDVLAMCGSNPRVVQRALRTLAELKAVGAPAEPQTETPT